MTSIAVSVIESSRLGGASDGVEEMQSYVYGQGVDRSYQESSLKVPAVYSPPTYSDDLYNYSPYPTFHPPLIILTRFFFQTLLSTRSSAPVPSAKSSIPPVPSLTPIMLSRLFRRTRQA